MQSLKMKLHPPYNIPTHHIYKLDENKNYIEIAQVKHTLQNEIPNLNGNKHSQKANVGVIENGKQEEKLQDKIKQPQFVA